MIVEPRYYIAKPKISRLGVNGVCSIDWGVGNTEARRQQMQTHLRGSAVLEHLQSAGVL